jgi:hypothetical protein
MIFELLGESLLDDIENKRYQGLTLSNIRTIAK